MKQFAIASDHAGVDLKMVIINYFNATGLTIKDFGPRTNDSCDYPDYGKKVAEFVSENPEEHIGILICGTGSGMTLVANKYTEIRAVVCYSEYATKMARAHNDANIMCLGSRATTAELAIEYIKIFLSVDFEGGRHAIRVEKTKI